MSVILAFWTRESLKWPCWSERLLSVFDGKFLNFCVQSMQCQTLMSAGLGDNRQYYYFADHFRLNNQKAIFYAGTAFKGTNDSNTIWSVERYAKSAHRLEATSKQSEWQTQWQGNHVIQWSNKQRRKEAKWGAIQGCVWFCLLRCLSTLKFFVIYYMYIYVHNNLTTWQRSNRQAVKKTKMACKTLSIWICCARKNWRNSQLVQAVYIVLSPIYGGPSKGNDGCCLLFEPLCSLFLLVSYFL